MAPRANWKGFLKLSLVSCGVALFPATSTRERIRFNIINRETGNRVRYRQVDAETGADVPEEDRVKGYKVSDGSYVLLEPEELDEVALESTHTIEIESFVHCGATCDGLKGDTDSRSMRRVASSRRLGGSTKPSMRSISMATTACPRS